MLSKEFDIIENLLTYKDIEPLDQISINELKNIQDLNVSNFTEADVREEIINPIVKILGYRKGQFASVDREKHIRFLNKSRYIDYKITLWEENFWIIEAKKPLDGDNFDYKALKQVTEYAIHPDINATIIVLCDGRKLELFDREDSLERPILSFKISELMIHIDSLRKILCPMQIWFFYKRRVLKAIDKAFEKEFNQERLNEFFKIIENKFRGKRKQILSNFKSNHYTNKNLNEEILKANIDEIVDIFYFFGHSVSTTQAMNKVLVDKYIDHGSFNVLNRIFPETYKCINIEYYMNALIFLLQLNKKIEVLKWAPSWLISNTDKTSSTVIKAFIKKTLNCFSDDIPRKTILLASATFRRIFKILYISKPDLREICKVNHLITRYVIPEHSWIQILSSPKKSIIDEIDKMTIISTDKFVKDFIAKQGYEFNTNLAKQNLQSLWLTEKNILQNTPNYFELCKELDLGEMYPTEASAVSFDYLGHLCLCVLKDDEEWLEYTLNNHRYEIESLAITGSWAAKKILEERELSDFKFDKSKYFAEQFFFGDTELSNSLRALYDDK